MTYLRNHLSRILLPIGLAALGAVLCVLLVPMEVASVKQQLLGFPDSDALAHQARPWILAALFFLPAFASFVYSLGGTLDRYVARQFAGVFGICLGALLMIWLLMDLTDKIADFRESKHVLQTILNFYVTRSPAVLLLLLPYSLLLALLHSLGKLSTSREIISMIQAGRSVVRITLPLTLAGLLFSLFLSGLNYHLAPTAEGSQDEILATASGKQVIEATQVLHYNPYNRRLWKVGKFPKGYEKGEPLLDVEISTTRRNKSLEHRLTAKRAFWDRDARRWTFEESTVGYFQANQPPVFEVHPEPIIIDSWPETPWQLIRPGLDPANLGIPDLNSWLQANARIGQFADAAPYLTQWHYRWALPFSCLVTVLLATPLGIHFSRRAPVGGIFLAIALSALMLLFTTISLAFGEAGTLRPALAAWLPNLAFALIGLYFFHRRISGQPLHRVLRRFLPSND